MNFINLAHGAFAMAGGYVTALLMNAPGRAVPALPAARLRRAGAARRAARAHALPAICTSRTISTRCCSRSASSSWRWRRSTTSIGSQQQIINLPEMAAGPHRDRLRRARHRHLPAVHHRGLRRCSTVALQSILSRTRFGSRLRAAVDDPRVARGLGINVDAIFAADLRGRLGAGRARRRARRRDPRPRPDLPAQVHDLFPDRRHGRRHLEHHRAVPGRRCCSASPTSRANTTCRSSAPSSSTRIMIAGADRAAAGPVRAEHAMSGHALDATRLGASRSRHAAAQRWRIRGRSLFWLAACALALLSCLPGTPPAAQRDRDPRRCSRSRSTSSSAMPASSRSATRRSSASAPMRRALLRQARSSRDPLLGPGVRGAARGGCSASSPASWCCAAPT